MTAPVKKYSDRSVEATERTRNTARIRSRAKHYLFQQCRKQAPEIYKNIIKHFEKLKVDGNAMPNLDFNIIIEPLPNHLIQENKQQSAFGDKVQS